MEHFLVDTSAHVIRGANAGRRKATCEDRADATDELVLVLDGASSLPDAPRFLKDRMSAGEYAAKVVEASLQISMLSSPEGSAGDLLCEANKLLASRIAGECKNQNREAFAKHHRPVTAAALVRVHDDGTYSWAIAGDCQIIVYDNDGNYMPLRKNYAGEPLEAERQALRKDIEQAEGCSVDMSHPVLKKLYEDRVKYHNTVFPVLNGESAFDDFMQRPEWAGTGSMDNVAGFIAYTDGAIWPHFDALDVDSLATTVVDEGVETYLAELLHELEKKPFHDDIAIAVGSVVHPTEELSK